MTTAHLVTTAASTYLAQGDGDSLRIFERRTEDAIGHVVDQAQKMKLIDDAKRDLCQRDSGAPEGGGRLQVLLDFLDRQRRIIRGELS